MESLRNLEQVHLMLASLHHHGLASGHSRSDRFLSEFLLFMVQSCGALSVEEKCGIVFKTLLKMPITVLEDAKGIVINECEPSGPSKDGRDFIFDVGSLQGSCKMQPQKNVCHEFQLCPLETNFENGAIIGLNAMERANSTLEDFCRTYFMFHGMDVSDPRTLFKYLPILSFTEGYIYQLDAMNEKILNLSANDDLTSIMETKGRTQSWK